jgi:flagellar L-ring protein precursor FlgH
MKSITVTALAALTVGAAAQSDNPGSLWSDGLKNPFADRKAHAVGDVLTVIVSERSSASSTAATNSSKSDNTKIEAGVGPILSAIIPGLETSLDSSMSGQGSTTRAGNLTARLTVIVREKLPNGNFVIEGTRHIQTNKETQKIIFTGIVRPDDILADNTVKSEYVAEANIRYDGKGTVGDRQRKGIISTLLDWLF